MTDRLPVANLAITATDAVKPEGSIGSTAFTFTVTRGGNTTGTSSVNFAVTGSGSNPASGADFVGGGLPTGTIFFSAGQTSRTITLNVVGDAQAEFDEGFTVTLSNPSSPDTITQATAQGIIRNDDGAVPATTLAIAALNASRLEGSTGSTPFTFIVTRGGNVSGTTSVNFATAASGSSPATGADFVGGTLPAGTVFFAAGQTTQTITLNVVGDTQVEANEGFMVTLFNPSPLATITTAAALGLIQNDDQPLPPTPDPDPGNGRSDPGENGRGGTGDDSGRRWHLDQSLAARCRPARVLSRTLPSPVAAPEVDRSRNRVRVRSVYRAIVRAGSVLFRANKTRSGCCLPCRATLYSMERTRFMRTSTAIDDYANHHSF